MSDNLKKNPVVSIVVPVYKAAAYLPQCIESILKQSFQNFELLLIDDGSPDDSPIICDRYAKLNTRIQVIHKENGGVSSARNKGIDVAIGKYIVFIDSDDYVGVDYLLDMLKQIERQQNSAERILVLSDYQPFNDSGDEQRYYPESFVVNLDKKEITADEFRSLVFDFRIFPPYCKLYRRDIITKNNIRFNTTLKTAEDFDFNIRYLKYIDKIYYIPSIQYHYRVGYKAYVPSNYGVLGQSEIKSAHIMANGMTNLAQRLDIYEELQDEIALWVAKKHYFNRLPMLFATSKKVGALERYKLYRQLISDNVYNDAYKKGVPFTVKSTTRLISSKFDYFISWWLFYKLSKML